MNIEDELKHKAYYIEFFAKMVTDHAESLEEYSGWLLNKTNQIQIEMERLREQNKKLVEALKFYAADENYYMHGTYGNTNVRNDNGKIAKEALNSIEKG